MLKKILLIALIIVAGGAVAFAVWMGPRNIIGMLRYDQRQEGRLKVGDRAPEVTLLALDGHTPVSLSSAIGEKPLVLVFGSFT